MRHAIPRRVRLEVIRRAERRCEYCRSPERFSVDSFAIDHITPVSRDGGDEIDNLAFSCQGCNSAKQSAIEAIDPETGNVAPLFHPRWERWASHFCWSDDHLRIEGITAIGRATVERLQLNREGVVNLRRLLLMAGEMPPP